MCTAYLSRWRDIVRQTSINLEEALPQKLTAQRKQHHHATLTVNHNHRLPVSSLVQTQYAKTCVAVTSGSTDELRNNVWNWN